MTKTAMRKEKKTLTLRYSLTQFTYWSSSTGAVSFAATYLLEQGITSGRVGTLLAAAGLLSCVLQPLLAAWVDRATRSLLTPLLLGLSGLCAACFVLQLLPGLPVAVVGFLYMAGICCSDAMVPLLNALSVTCTRSGYDVNYGAARGIGSAASALSTLALGFLIARQGMRRILVFVLLFRLLSIAVLAGYPRLQKDRGARRTEDTGGIARFFARYPRYCISLVGIMLLAMFHAMTENYMIAIVGRLGGNSGHVGTALFIASACGAPVIFYFARIRNHVSDTGLIKLAGVSFLLKSVGFCFARSIGSIYLLQLLQMSSYAFLAPAQVYYAGARVCPHDMVKGQAFITATYALGCAAGNFSGGQLLPLGVDTLLAVGVLMALAGTAILWLTVDKKDDIILHEKGL